MAFALTSAFKVNSTIPITQTVTIDGVEMYSQSSGHDLLNECAHFSAEQVNDRARPSITVCGTQTKVTVFLLNRCSDRHNQKTVEIRTCNSGAASGSCVTASPATHAW